ncbi:unnamed protein product [Leptosia nina]|uniref:BEN domain-containing protein n=1 Tax=Leptosia nina TaxID=320188 RepID=A0AAV1K548_9NEOP
MTLELDAAHALLELRGHRHVFHRNGYERWTRGIEEIVAPPTISNIFNGLITKKLCNDSVQNTSTPKRQTSEGLANKINGTHTITTREIGMQTDIENLLAEVDRLNNIIKDLYKTIEVLQARLKHAAKTTSPIYDSNFYTDTSSDERTKTHNRRTYKRKRTTTNNTNNESSDFDVTMTRFGKPKNTDPEFKISKADSSMKKALKPKNLNKMGGEMISIGDGNAVVPARLLKYMDWTSYTNATRKLLTAVFPRNVLATHSLTGKRSPAFPNKPAKKKLDAALVNDIVQTVVEKCNVPENVVRTSITTKCADESKMFRSRQVSKKKRKALKKENISPSDNTESEFSS